MYVIFRYAIIIINVEKFFNFQGHTSLDQYQNPHHLFHCHQHPAQDGPTITIQHLMVNSPIILILHM